jgi:NitT/TauT family transport system permease protein
MKRMWQKFGPVFTVVLGIFALWYLMAIVLNSAWTIDKLSRSGETMTVVEHVADTWSQKKPRLPAPHQVAVELWNTTAMKSITSKRSLVFHAGITLSSTLLGFAMGTVLGILLAVGIVHNKAMNLSVMPWVIASQTIPILAIAPMIIVVLNAVGISGLVPKAVISMYLSFFPVVVGMVKGLRAPDAMQMDQMRTWNASKWTTFWALRWPSSVPFLFPSLKIGVAAALVGAIVAELPTGAVRGLGARLLAGSYYGQTIQIWSALLMAAALAASLVMILGQIEKFTLRKMGMSR